MTKPYPRVEIMVDQEHMEFIVSYPGANLLKRYLSIDQMWRELRERLQDIRYGDKRDLVNDEMIAKPLEG
jgi:hypothetical protein